ncbi:hypothetical protein [Kordiimonas pumila]|uniref:Uncharacterized protein n=1 Tax=Kordiimonas pumila TaxID=2161677 RepID=A0ABV7D3H0_9PROT|nr:hypothetical protein [Kordiimonas pumila]
MPNKNNIQQQKRAESLLISELESWGLFNAFAMLKNTDLLVTDPDIKQALLAGSHSGQAILSSPDSFRHEISGTVKRVFFFCRSREHALKRETAAVWPKLKVYSVTYDLAVAGFHPENGFCYPSEAPAKHKKEPIVLFSLKGGDGGYLIRLMRNARMPLPVCKLDRRLATWALSQRDFQLSRLLIEFQRYAAEKRFFLHVESDVLAMFYDANESFTARAQKLLLESEAKILYLTRRDKCLQVALATALPPEYSCLWDMLRKDVRLLAATDISISKAMADIQHLVLEEAIIEAVVSNELTGRMITVEELAESPHEVMQSLAQFLGVRVPGNKLEIPDFYGRYKDVKGLHDIAAKIKGYIITQLGLVKNKDGSFENPIDSLTRKASGTVD